MGKSRRGAAHHDLTRRWTKSRDRWQSSFKLCPHSDLGSWLFAKWAGGEVTGLGCKACHLVGPSSSAAATASWTIRDCEKQLFQRHARCMGHLRAVAALGLCDECSEAAERADDVRRAPSKQEFIEVWDSRRRNDGPGVTKSRKPQQLEFCLAEAMRMQDREHLRQCETLVVHVDGKGKLLSMRVAATSKQLIVKRFFLGHVKHVGAADSIEAYVESVTKLLRDFCTAFLHAPGVWTPQFDGRVARVSCSALEAVSSFPA